MPYDRHAADFTGLRAPIRAGLDSSVCADMRARRVEQAFYDSPSEAAEVPGKLLFPTAVTWDPPAAVGVADFDLQVTGEVADCPDDEVVTALSQLWWDYAGNTGSVVLETKIADVVDETWLASFHVAQAIPGEYRAHAGCGVLPDVEEWAVG